MRTVLQQTTLPSRFLPFEMSSENVAFAFRREAFRCLFFRDHSEGVAYPSPPSRFPSSNTASCRAGGANPSFLREALDGSLNGHDIDIDGDAAYTSSSGGGDVDAPHFEKF